MCVTITPRAAKYMRQMVRFGDGSATAGFRLSAKPGGCSGVDSSFTVEEKPQPGDTVVEQNGALLFMEEATCDLLKGSTIDFKESAMGAGLEFLNVAKHGACACGPGAGSGMPMPGGSAPVTFISPSAISKTATAAAKKA
jgi:iron-sulfur cluster assembly accessory protein